MAPDPAASRGRLTAERDRLAALERTLREGLAGESESASLEELSDVDQHPAETATETVNREQDLSTLESVAGELAEVDRALERLDQGSYGICTACGRPIGAERLEALPATPFCIGDAQMAEAESSPGVAPVGRPGPAPAGGGGSGLEEPGRPI